MKLPSCPSCECTDRVALLISGATQPDGATQPSKLWVCASCRHGFLDPIPNQEALDRFYGSVSYRRTGSLLGAVFDRAMDALCALRVKRIERVLGRRGALLDFGCGKGRFLRVAARRGWAAQGVEPNPESAKVAAAGSGCPVHVGTFGSALLKAASQDAASLWHVLEHLAEPGPTLQTIGRTLRPGGVLAVAVPNFWSWQRLVFGHRWWHLQLPGHIHHYSRRSLLMLLRRSGFTPRSEIRHSLDHGYFALIASIAGTTARRTDFLITALKPPANHAIPRQARIRALVILLLVSAVATPLLLLEALASAFGAGGELEIYATRDP